VSASYDTDDDDLATDDVILAALRDATCAQIELWVTLGERLDIEAWPAGTYTGGKLTVAGPPGRIAPRAARILRSEGLLSGGAL
jgi:hypothetical protein